MLERTRVIFIVRERAPGDFWIYLEPWEENLSVLGSGFLAFDLSEGTTVTKAEKIAAFLQENISSVSYTVP